MKRIVLITCLCIASSFCLNAQTEEVFSSGTSGDMTLKIEADIDNNNENDNPKIKLSQDGGLNNGIIGLNGDANSFFTNSTVNSLFVKAPTNSNFQIVTNDIARLTINKLGKIGIDTTMPESILQLGHGSNPNSSNFLTLGKRVDTEEINLPFIGHDALSVKNDLGLGSRSTNGGINFYTGNGNAFSKHLIRMRILANGNIGVGKNNPSEKLDVNGLIRIPAANNEDNNSPGIVLASNDDFLYDGQYINHYGFGFHGFQDGSTTSAEPANSYMSGYFGIDFFTTGQNRMRISRDGIVSIGTVNRQIGYKLAVNGNIKAKEIKVETGWADFVFNKNYNLPTLTEVEQHIKEKGHLKDIPSAEEVAKNGILLGEMDSKLLQKIEELMLYAIEQQKEIDVLKKEIKKLKK